MVKINANFFYANKPSIQFRLQGIAALNLKFIYIDDPLARSRFYSI